MKEGYKVLKYCGIGLYIDVHNYKALNEIGHYRYSGDYRSSFSTTNKVGTWKPKLIKE